MALSKMKVARAKAVMKATHLTTLYVESLSEGEFWSSSDEEHAELFEQVLEGAYHSRLSSELRLDLAERTSLLLLDKDLQHEEEGEILHPNSSQ